MKVTGRKQSREAKRVMMDVDDGIIESGQYKEWLEQQLPKYMFYSRIGKVRMGVCECGGKSVIKKGRSGEYTFCPCCHERVKLRDSRYPHVDDLIVVAVLSDDGSNKGIVQRLFVVTKVSELIDGSVKTRMYSNEEQRDYISFENDMIHSIHPVAHWNYSNGKWKRSLTSFRSGPGKVHGQGWSGWRAEDRAISLYRGNIKIVLNGTKYQYSALDIASERSKVNPIYYLQRYSQYPVLEMLYKSGLVRLAEQLMQINDGWYRHEVGSLIAEAKTLKDLYINNKAELEEAAKGNYGIQELQALSFVRKWNICEEDKNRAIEFMKVVIQQSGEDFEYSFISNQSLFNYAVKQINLERAVKAIAGKLDFDNERDFGKFFRDYTDYIGACVELEYDVKNTAISKPHDFKKMHDNVMAIQKYNNSHIYDVGVAAAWLNLHNFVDYTDGTLSLLMAKTAEDIIKEGAELSHCVGRYCARVARGESVICFIRKNDEIDKPWYTAELKPDMKFCDIVQCRGFKNEDDEARPLVDKFLRKYVKWFNKREPEGYDEDRLTAIYYKAVRKTDKGEYISIYDSKVKYKIGVETSVKADKNPDKVCVEGMHIASLDFAKQFGRGYTDAVILEIQVNIHDVIIPDAEDQVRCSRYKILREVPYSELGEWGAERMKKVA